MYIKYAHFTKKENNNNKKKNCPYLVLLQINRSVDLRALKGIRLIKTCIKSSVRKISSISGPITLDDCLSILKYINL